MAEYIDREKLISVVKMDEYGITWDSDSVINLLRSADEEDVSSVVHGRWIYDADAEKTYCSECSAYNKQYKPPYCPHCGAKMDLEG